MDSLWFHPKLVHVPMALAVLMPLIAGGLFVSWWRGWLPARAWLVAVLLQAALVVSGAIAMNTGETDEEKVEKVLSERLIKEHEERAEAFTWTGGGVLLLMVGALVGSLKSRNAAVAVAAAATVGTVVVFVLGYRTGEAGGELVYKHGAASAFATPTAGNTAAGGGGAAKDDDDD